LYTKYIPKGSKIKKKEIITSKDKLKEYLDKNPKAKEQYLSNQVMIDFNNIPKKYYDMIIENYIKLF
jgi:hypothetical protein